MMLPMSALRFLALLSTGFVLLMLAFLLHVSHARVEREGSRHLEGPPLELAPGARVTWELDLGGLRIDEAWPAVQRQPRLFASGVPAGATLEATAQYGAGEEGARPAFFAGAGVQPGVVDETPGELAFGPLWLSYEHPLRVELVCVDPGEGGTATPVLRGDPGTDFRAARAISRTVWLVFVAIGAASFALLMVTQRGLFASESRGPGPKG